MKTMFAANQLTLFQRARASLSILLASLAVSSSAAETVIDLTEHFKGHDAAFVLLNLKSGDLLRHNPQGCATRRSPCSTFKIPNTIIALETGVASGPEFMLPWDGTVHPIKAWNRNQTLGSAFQDSCFWFYQEIARRVGTPRMQSHLARWSYGNEDTTGGLDQFWLSSTLLVSPDEQVHFLRRLHEGDLNISKQTRDIVLDLMLFMSEDGLVIRGKTGTAGDPVKGVATEGWYVGLIERVGRHYAFAAHISGGANPSGRAARGIVERVLREIAK